jgi:hypothetical protein
MPNTLLTPDMITREALRVLHQKLTFVGSINRAYDNSFAQSGAKIGDTLRIRLPNQYTVRTGAALAAQDTVEQNTTLQVATQRGVDLSFTSVDLTMDLDDFSKRIIQPAMAVLSASIEADALQNMTRDVYQVVNGIGSAITFKNVMNGRKRLNDSLAPNGDRTALLNTQDNVELVDALKGLFQDSNAIKQQYREGVMGMTGGFEFAETTHMTTQSRGTANTGYLTNSGTAQTGSSIVVDTGTGTIGVGEVITIAGVFEVHPETKVATNRLQQFVVTSAYAGGAGTIQISPAIVATGARQNVSNGAADNQAITVIGASGTAYGQSLVYHKDAFTFATADLVLPQGVDMASRQVYDGISMRMVRQYDINNDAFPVRLDVLYGYKTLRAQLAARLLSNA